MGRVSHCLFRILSTEAKELKAPPTFSLRSSLQNLTRNLLLKPKKQFMFPELTLRKRKKKNEAYMMVIQKEKKSTPFS